MRPRIDIHGSVHKGLRGAMADALLALGRMDPQDSCEVRDAIARLEDMLRICEAHAERENEIVNRAVEARRPGATERFIVDHDLHSSIIEQLRELAARRDASLYSRTSAFVAEMLAHMAREEWEGEGLLHEAFDDIELAQLQRRLDASLAASEGMATLRWIIPALSHPERVAMLERIREIDASGYEAALGLAKANLAAGEFGKLESRLRGNDGGRGNDEIARANDGAAQRGAATLES